MKYDHPDYHWSNALNAHCHWCLRKDGKNVDEATSALAGRSVADKNELLFQHATALWWNRRGIANVPPRTVATPKGLTFALGAVDLRVAWQPP